MADDMVDRGADRLGVAAIEQRRGIGPVIHRERVDQPIEMRGRNARLHLVDQQIERLRGEAAGLAHRREGLNAVQPDLAGLAADLQAIGRGCHRLAIIPNCSISNMSAM